MAVLKKEYDLIELNALTKNSEVTSDIHDEIQQINTYFGKEFTKKTREIFGKYSNLLKLPTNLLPNRPGFDHEIPLIENATVPPAKVYRMSIAELEELRKQLISYLSKNWIRFSTSNFAAPVLFQRKADGSLRLCVVYRQLNTYTKRVEFPLPHIDTLLDQLAGFSDIYSIRSCPRISSTKSERRRCS